MRSRGRSALWGGLLALPACWAAPSTGPENPSELIVVRAVLSSLAVAQVIEVELARRLGIDSSTTAVADAVVEVRSGDAVYRFASATPGRYIATMSVEPGAQYELSISALGRTITGVTTAPGAVEILKPDSSVRFPGHAVPITMLWTSAAGASAFAIYVDKFGIGDVPGRFNIFDGYTSDTSLVNVFGPEGCREDACADARVKVIAVTAPFLAYFGGAADPDTSSLVGAVGVFAAVTGDTVTIRFGND